MPAGADLHPAAAHRGGDGLDRLVLADDLPGEHVLQVGQLGQLVFLHPGSGDAGPQLDDIGQVLLLHRGEGPLALQLVQALLQGGDAVVGLGQLLVVHHAAGGVLQVLLVVFLLAQGQLLGVVLLQLFVAQGGAGAGLVQQVDGLVGQVAVVDVPLRQHHHPPGDVLAYGDPVEALVIALDARIIWTASSMEGSATVTG